MFPPLNAVDAEDRLLAMPVGARDKERRRLREWSGVYRCLAVLSSWIEKLGHSPSFDSSLFLTYYTTGRTACRTPRHFTKLKATETKGWYISLPIPDSTSSSLRQQPNSNDKKYTHVHRLAMLQVTNNELAKKTVIVFLRDLVLPSQFLLVLLT